MRTKIIIIRNKTDLYFGKSYIQCTHNKYIFYIYFLYIEKNKSHSPYPIVVLYPDKLEYYIRYPYHCLQISTIAIFPRFCNIWNYRSIMIEELRSVNAIIRAYERKYKLNCTHGINSIKKVMIDTIDLYLNTYNNMDDNLYQRLNEEIKLDKLIY